MGEADRGYSSRLRIGGWVRAQPHRRSTSAQRDTASHTVRLPKVVDSEPEPLPPFDDRRPYRGRRREAPGRLGRWAQVVILALLVLAGGGLLLRSFLPADPPGAAGLTVPGQLPAVPGAATDPTASDAAGQSSAPTSSTTASPQPSNDILLASASPPPPGPTASPRLAAVSYEAEAGGNTLTGTALVRAAAAASGGHVVGGLGDGPGNTLRFNDVAANQAGSYTLTIYYISPELRRAYLEVNGTRLGNFEYASTGGTAVGSIAVTVTLRVGKNTIQFGGTPSPAPDLDRVLVR
jgi:Carbohydrate binding module (family 35)